jgi:hypothetical protein
MSPRYLPVVGYVPRVRLTISLPFVRQLSIKCGILEVGTTLRTCTARYSASFTCILAEARDFLLSSIVSRRFWGLPSFYPMATGDLEFKNPGIIFPLPNMCSWPCFLLFVAINSSTALSWALAVFQILSLIHSI